MSITLRNNIIKMVDSSEMHKITILRIVDYEDHTRTQMEVPGLFHEEFSNWPPIFQETTRKIEKQFRLFGELGHVRQMRKIAANAVSDDTKLDILLEFEENPHKSVQQQFKTSSSK